MYIKNDVHCTLYTYTLEHVLMNSYIPKERAKPDIYMMKSLFNSNNSNAKGYAVCVRDSLWHRL